MFAVAAGVLAALMMVIAAARGLRPAARVRERVYTRATGAWSLFGLAVYHPATLGRLAPVGLAANPLAVTLFGFGLLALGVYGASLLIGGSE